MGSRACAFAVLALGLAGCGGSAPPPPVPTPGPDGIVVMRPHWDQVCRDVEGPLLLRTPEEVLEEGDLRGILERAFPPQTPGPAESGPPFVDVAVNYDPPGTLRTAQLLDHNVDETLAREVSALVASEVRDPVRILAPVRLRIRVSRDPELRMAVLPALWCMPHIAHDEDEPPRLHGGARVIGGVSRSTGFPGDGVQVGVALDISAEGRLDGIRVLRGDPELAERVRMALDGVRIDPALLNGEPVPGSLTLTFRFPGPEGLSPLPSPPPGPASTPGRRPPP
jgi:hypothetical protein